MSSGQRQLYRSGFLSRLRVIDSVGSEVTSTTHDVTCQGDEIVAVKESGVTPEVGDYIISDYKVGHSDASQPLTHLTAAKYTSEGWRRANLG